MYYTLFIWVSGMCGHPAKKKDLRNRSRRINRMSDMNVSGAINTFSGYQSTARNTNRTTTKTTATASKGVTDIVDISQKNEGKLSSKAQEYLKSLREKYGDYDFLVGNSTDDLKTLSKSGSKEFSVIFSNAEIEKMASNEKYAAEKMQGVECAVKMCRRICEENGFVSAFDAMKTGNGTVNKIGIVTDDNGNRKFFAELEKSSDKQKERIDKYREKKDAERKEAEKKASKKSPYEKEEKDTVKRTTVEADSMEELIKKIKNIDWNNISDSKSGDRFDFTV